MRASNLNREVQPQVKQGIIHVGKNRPDGGRIPRVLGFAPRAATLFFAANFISKRVLMNKFTTIILAGLTMVGPLAIDA